MDKLSSMKPGTGAKKAGATLLEVHMKLKKIFFLSEVISVPLYALDTTVIII